MLSSVREDKQACPICQKLFTRKTLTANSGICGRCASKFEGKKSQKYPCSVCRKHFTERTLKKYSGKCGKCANPDAQNTRSHRQMIWVREFGHTETRKCPLCGINDVDPFTFEKGHDIARARGGSTDIRNMRPVCRTCNTSQGTQTVDEFKASIGTDGTGGTGGAGGASAPAAARESVRHVRTGSLSDVIGTMLVDAFKKLTIGDW